MASNNLIAAKRSYANDISVKWAQNDDEPIIKLRRTAEKRPTSRSISPKKEDMKQQSPRKSILKK